MTRDRSPRPARPARDQDQSAFSTILENLVGRLPGARAAALVDVEGETVDYGGTDEPYELRVAAAHWRITLEALRERPLFASAQIVGVRTSRRGFIVFALPQEYAVVVSVSRGASLAIGRRAIPACVRSLAEEAGWARPEWASWFSVEVRCDERQRPSAVSLREEPVKVDVLGALAAGLGRGERGWRVRCAREEVTLVCEPGGFWYSDEKLVGSRAKSPGPQSPTL